MCGIIGYIGNKEASPILIEGLKKLEYRGYDSAGVATINNKNILIKKDVGKISEIEKKLNWASLLGNVGIAHTRWSTHGAVTKMNAHPHNDCKNEIALVHNGIIENYAELRFLLAKEGHSFKSETDTEVLAHLIEKFLEHCDIENAIIKTLKIVEGAYALAILYVKEPEKIFIAKKSSPLVIGLGKDEMFVASDVIAIMPHTKKIVYLNDNEIAILTKQSYTVKNFDAVKIDKKVQELKWDIEQTSLNGFDHFMLKEIFEQPTTIQNAFKGRIDIRAGNAKFGGINLSKKDLKEINRVILTACGTSWHACLIGKYLFEDIVKIPVQVEYASELRYSKPILDKNVLVIALSQSGETADTIAALEKAKKQNAKTFGIVNVVGSTITRMVDGGIYLHAGPEIGVASTKAFTSQLVVLYLLAIFLARAKEQLNNREGVKMLKLLQEIPKKVKKVLDANKKIKDIAKKYCSISNALYLGRGYNFPVALEGALKLKEISYIHAEGYPAAEMKHGPIALVDKNMPSIFIAPSDRLSKKILSNIEEVKSRGGKIIIITTPTKHNELKDKADEIIYVPNTTEQLMPILTVIPTQLLAYHIAVARGCDVDKPRNLAKSVTVE